eukprot:EG_transcript_25945
MELVSTSLTRTTKVHLFPSAFNLSPLPGLAPDQGFERHHWSPFPSKLSAGGVLAGPFCPLILEGVRGQIMIVWKFLAQVSRWSAEMKPVHSLGGVAFFAL